MEMFSTGVGDDASPPTKVEASDSDSDKNSALSTAMDLPEELDNHSFGKGEGGHSDALAPQVTEKADVGVVSDMESPGGDG